MPSLVDKVNRRAAGDEVLDTESHIVGARESGWIKLNEVPLRETPSSVSIPGFVEVTTSPAAGEFRPVYSGRRHGWIEFHPSDDGTEVAVTRKGRGSPNDAEDLNDLRDFMESVEINVLAYGALGDGRRITDGAMTSGSALFTSASAGFSLGDVGKVIVVRGAGATAGTDLAAKIAGYVSATQITLSVAATSTVAGAEAYYGTDDTDAIKLASDALNVVGRGVLKIPARIYMIFGPDTVNTALAAFDGASGVAILAHGATLVIAQEFATAHGRLWLFEDSENITVDGCVVRGPRLGYDGGSGIRGLYLCQFIGSRGISMPRNSIEGGTGILFDGDGTDATRTRDIHVGLLDVAWGTYGIDCKDSGDDLVVDLLRTDHVIRSHLMTGVRRVRTRIHSTDAYADDCRMGAGVGFVGCEDIEVHYTQTDATTESSDQSNKVVIAADYRPGTFRNINIRLDVTFGGVGDTGAQAFKLTKTDEVGNSDTADRGHLFENITIGGRVKGLSSYGVFSSIGQQRECVFGPGDTFRGWALRDLVLEDTRDVDFALDGIEGRFVLENVYSTGTSQACVGIHNSARGAPPLNGGLEVIGGSFPNRDTAAASNVVGGFSYGVRYYSTNGNMTIRPGYTGMILSNSAAAGAILWTLPVAVEGLEYIIFRRASHALLIDPNGTEIIRTPTTGGVAGKYLSLDSDGASVHLRCMHPGTWEIVAQFGTHSYEP